MVSRYARNLAGLDLEDRILVASSLFALIFVGFPWLSGEWLGGDPVAYSGFQFYTSFLGILVFLLHASLLAITLVPVFGGPVLIRKRYKEFVRLCIASQATVLVLAALSVMVKVTYEFSRVEVRFGIYFTLIGSFVSAIYAFLKWQEQRRSEVQELFRHPDDHTERNTHVESVIAPPPPPPPPPPLKPEEHHFRP